MRYKGLALSIVAALFIGCGGGSDSSSTSGSSSDTTNTGVFVDAPVMGLNYKTTSGIEGVTNSAGEYRYKEGDYVTFSLGNVVLGEAKASFTVTPLDVSDNNWTKAANIAYVLQSLDTDGNNTDELIALPDETVLKNILTDINLSDETNVSSVISTVKTEIAREMNISLPDINLTDANETMANYLKDYTITEEFGFGKYALEGKSFYLVMFNPDYNNGEWVSFYYVSFDENTLTFTDYKYNGEDVTIHIKIPYSIENGKLIEEFPKATSTDVNIEELELPETNLTISVTNIYGDIVETIDTNSAKSYLVTNLDEAQKLAELLNMQEKKAWSAKFLDGRTLYSVESNNMYKFSFNNGKIYYYNEISADYWGEGASTGYRIIDNDGNEADYGIIEANETEVGNPDGYQYYKIIDVDPLKGIFSCYDNDNGLADAVANNTISQHFFTDYGEAVKQLQENTEQLFNSIKTNYFGGINEDGTSFYVVGKDDNGKWIMATLFVYDWGTYDRGVVYNDLSVNKYAEGNWSVSDDNATLTFTLDTDYYGDGITTENWTITSVGDGYFEINDGDYTNYLFLDKQKAEEFLEEKQSQ
jgi:hypothetical protein